MSNYIQQLGAIKANYDPYFNRIIVDVKTVADFKSVFNKMLLLNDPEIIEKHDTAVANDCHYFDMNSGSIICFRAPYKATMLRLKDK